MHKRIIQFDDLDGVTQTETFWFNLSTTEFAQLGFMQDTGGLEARLEAMLKSRDVAGIVGFYTEIIDASYGVRSEDGKRFMKSPELSRAFRESPAFDSLMDELLTEEDGATGFLLAVAPKKLLEKMNEAGITLPTQKKETVVELPNQDEAVEFGATGQPAPTLTDTLDEPEMDEETLRRHLLGEDKVEEVPWAHRAPTKAELRGMTREQLVEVFNRKNRKDS